MLVLKRNIHNLTIAAEYMIVKTLLFCTGCGDPGRVPRSTMGLPASAMRPAEAYSGPLAYGFLPSRATPCLARLLLSTSPDEGNPMIPNAVCKSHRFSERRVMQKSFVGSIRVVGAISLRHRLATVERDLLLVSTFGGVPSFDRQSRRFAVPGQWVNRT